MKVLVHEIDGEFMKKIEKKYDKVVVADGRYAPCQGCFKCWTKHPAACALKDTLHEMSRVLGNADDITIVTENYYGGYSPNVKCILDRSIGLVTPLSKYRNGRMHHVLRYKNPTKFRVIVLGDVSEKEKETWTLMVKSNCDNNGYKSSSVEFVTKDEIQGGNVL